jgi:hypothetical protein
MDAVATGDFSIPYKTPVDLPAMVFMCEPGHKNASRVLTAGAALAEGLAPA